MCLKAYESLLLLACLQGELHSLQLQLAVLLAGRLQELHLLLPLECLEAGQLQSWPATPWRYSSTVHKATGQRSAELLLLWWLLCSSAFVLSALSSRAAAPTSAQRPRLRVT